MAGRNRGEKEEVGEGEEKGKKEKEKKKEREKTRRHASPLASWDRTSILVCFKPASGPLRAYARAYHTNPL